MNVATFLSEITAGVFFVTVFVLVYVTVCRTLRDNASFGKAHTIVLALCVSILSVLGMVQSTTWPLSSPGGEPVSHAPRNLLHWILVPYVCLAVTVLLAQLLALTSRILPDEKDASRVKKAKAKTSVKTKMGRDRPEEQRSRNDSPQNQTSTREAGSKSTDPASPTKQGRPNAP